ncbi:MAG: hypothetical protein A2Y97_08260 [Nitrospirae bacterium RBG_13_39_12]|nr:MAG: hypothetical protein A2Y97_08260 [Nitrospirae bacterium RBG_13_39_12]
MKNKQRKKIKIVANQIQVFEAFVNEINRESDRAAVILGTSKLEDLLYQLLNKYFISEPPNKSELFDGTAPLSTFSSKINICYRLGIIDKEFKKLLNVIKDIRNSFAHEVQTPKLDSGPHRDRIKEITRALEHYYLFSRVKKTYFNNKKEIIADFFAAIVIMSVRLETISMKINTLTGKSAFSVFAKKG